MLNISDQIRSSVNCFVRCTLHRSTGSLICRGVECVQRVFSSDISPLVTLLQFSKAVSPLIQEASSILINWRGVAGF